MQSLAASLADSARACPPVRLLPQLLFFSFFFPFKKQEEQVSIAKTKSRENFAQDSNRSQRFSFPFSVFLAFLLAYSDSLPLLFTPMRRSDSPAGTHGSLQERRDKKKKEDIVINKFRKAKESKKRENAVVKVAHAPVGSRKTFED